MKKIILGVLKVLLIGTFDFTKKTKYLTEFFFCGTQKTKNNIDNMRNSRMILKHLMKLNIFYIYVKKN